MGKLTSVPKAPAAPTYVYVPAPAPTPSSQNTPSNPTPASSPDTSAEDEAAQAARRVAGILSSRRGRISTILTSFRGFLEPAAASPARKTLLGE